MSHKRVSQLVELTAAEVAGGDLVYVVDVSAREGKKMQITELGDYLSVSASLNAVHATQADTASYVFGSDVHGTVESSSYAGTADTAISASWAARSFSSSYASTASFAMNSTAGSSTSSSWASASLSASWADRSGVALSAIAASSLVYPNSSTASYAMKAQLVDTASYAKTASFIAGPSASVSTASYALRSGFSSTSNVSNLALELSFPNTSTASYAITSENFSYNHFIDFGVYLATTQSISASQLDLVEVSSSTGLSKPTNVMAMGTVIVPYTSSIAVDESLSLVIKSRDTGDETTLDTTPVFFDVSRTVNAWDSLMSGSIKIPYTLEGSSSMLGNYVVFVTGSSSRIKIEPTRLNRFNLSSFSDTLNVSTAEPPLFQVSPEELVTLTFYTGSHEGPFTDTRNGMLSSGSQNIDDVSFRNQAATSVRYVWSLQNLRILDCGDNGTLTSLTGMPDTMVTLSCDSCSIASIQDLDNATGMTYFNCGNNNLGSLPALPISLSYLNCNQNLLTTLPALPETMSYLNASDNLIANAPAAIPYGVTDLYLGNNQITSMFSTLPAALVTMSIFNNPMTSLSVTFPAALGWIVASGMSITSFPDVPAAMLYLDVTSCSLSQASMNTICSQSVVNGLTNGIIYLNGNGPILISTVNDYILTLQGLGWTVSYDYAV